MRPAWPAAGNGQDSPGRGEVIDVFIVGLELGNHYKHECAHPQRQGGEQRCHAGTISGDRIDGLLANDGGREHEVGYCAGVEFAVGADKRV